MRKESYLTIIKRIIGVALSLSLVASMLLISGCGKDEQADDTLGPLDIFYEVMELTENKRYDDVASYCRSFSAYSVERYFSETDTKFQLEWTERYSETLYKLFRNYVTFERVEEVVDYDNRVATVSGIFTSVDLERLNQTIEYKVNSELKDDFFKQMDYIDSVIEQGELKSVPFRFELKFRYTNKNWRIDDENFLILLTMGHYAR